MLKIHFLMHRGCTDETLASQLLALLVSKIEFD
jgi:hypothetical protein